MNAAMAITVLAACSTRGAQPVENRVPLAARVQVIDLDAEDAGVWRLAEAAGACNDDQPAFIRTWCQTEHPHPGRFSQRFDTTATDVGDGKVAVRLPVIEHGKGFVTAFALAGVPCVQNTCMPPSTTSVVIRTTGPIEVARVRRVAFTFDVDRMWRDRSWWGPLPTHVTVELFDAAGTQLGTGTGS